VIALANNPTRVRDRRVTGFSLEEDKQIEKLFGENFIPYFPQPVLEGVGVSFTHVEPWGVRVVVDHKLVTGQNQQSASEYALALHHLLTGADPVVVEAAAGYTVGV
jgi:putative intracellular protease/amidase